MPQIVTIILDNILNSQNQDYLPSRYVLQKEVIDALVTQILENDAQSLVGLIPLAQKTKNEILTPTRERNQLSSFLHTRDLHREHNHMHAWFQAEQSLGVSDFSEKCVFMILASPIQNAEEFLAEIYNMAARGTQIKVLCIAEAREFGGYLAEGSSFANLSVLSLGPEENFNQGVGVFFSSTEGLSYGDPDLDEAIRRSMIEK